jgi:hypothetical protein
LFKAFFLFIAGTIAFALFVSLIAAIFGGVAWWPINNFLWTSKYQQVMAWLTLILFLIVPLIAFITWIVRRMLRVRSRSNYLGWVFGGLWSVGWVVMILFVSSMVRDFSREKFVTTEATIAQPTNNKMVIAVSQPELEYNGRFGWMNDDGEGWNLSDDSLSLSWVNFNVKQSNDDQYHVNIIKRSFGKTAEDAINRASAIHFNITSKDSVLDIPNGFSINKENKFRGQHVEVEIYVPLGKKIRFDESVRMKLNSVRLKVKKSRRQDRVNGVVIHNEEHSFPYETNLDYEMGVDGELKVVGGTAVPANNDTSNPDMNVQPIPGVNQDSIDREIEKIKNDQREKDRKLKELEKLKNKTKTVSETGNNRKEEKLYVSSPSPISTLVEWF